MSEKIVLKYLMKKVTPTVVAKQFYQTDSDILTTIRMEVLDMVPLVGEKK
jgi:hypothetical protein